MRNVSLRRRLLLLALVGILPLAATSGIGLFALVKQQRAQAEQSGLSVTRALATAVDAALSESVSVLEALATSALLDAGNPGKFQGRALRVMSTQPNWILIHLADPAGQVILNTSYPIALPAPPIPERESFDQLIRTGKPVVGYLSRGPGGIWGVPIRVPVLRDGRLRFVLTGVVKPDAFLELVMRQHVPQDWVVSIFDVKGIRVARSRQHEKFIGEPPSESLRQLLATGEREGTGVTTVLEGGSVYTAYTRAQDSGWVVAIGIPSGSVDAGGFKSLVAFGAGILLSLVFAVITAFGIARSINHPIRKLADATRALARDEPLEVPATDIGEIADLANALAASAAEAKEARQQAETASRAKDEFLAMLGHELRNPLAPIVTALRLMQMRKDGDTTRERAIIERQVGHLSRLVDDLLDISRITRGKIELHRSRMDLRTVVGRALEMMQPALQKRVRPVDLGMPSHPVYVLGDATRLTQVLANLVANAVRHTPGDGRIAIRIADTQATAELVVEDSGSGISADLMHRLFDLFIQGEQSIDRRAGGLGLGLAIVKALVELHGGTVSASSEGAGRGSTFTVSLPKSDGAVLVVRNAQAKSIQRVQRGARILVVDDNADATEMLALLLQGAGYDVRTAADAEAALVAIEAWHPELAVLDIGLPGMDGHELAVRIRMKWQPAQLKLIALTGYGRDSDREHALKSGFDVHLTKPAESEHLLEEIAKLLGDAGDPVRRETGSLGNS
jgi:signal transduction histidine kinase/ActR/RegA family two-component response regulator